MAAKEEARRVGDRGQVAPQLHQRAEALKDYVSRKKDLFHDGEAWSSHQELQSLYQRLLLTDLDYALDKKAEVDLWNACFKNYITHLQEVSRDRSVLKQKRAQEAQVTLTWFLETASGFYHMLLQELRETFDLDLPFMRPSAHYGLAQSVNDEEDSNFSVARKEPRANNCVYIVQHCLVHLGDLARYRSQMRQAESFYRHAVRIAPGSGQAYNQLALLEASRNDKLGAVFFYVRALALKYPFPAAATNLNKMTLRMAEEKTEFGEKLTDQTFVPCCLRFLSLLHHVQHLRTAAKLCHRLNESLTSLVASESLETWTLVQVLAVTFYLIHKNVGDVVSPSTLSSDEQEVTRLLCEFVAGLLNSLLLPVYTLKQGESLLEYFALPAIKLILDWIAINAWAVEERGFLKRLQIWPGLCRMLNELVLLPCDHKKYSKFQKLPLPEDYDLQSYLPLLPKLKGYDFKEVASCPEEFPTVDQQYVRTLRIIDLGTHLSKDPIGMKVILCEDFRDIDGASDKVTFKPVEYKVPDEIIRELDSLDLISSSEDEESYSKDGEADDKTSGGNTQCVQKAEGSPDQVLPGSQGAKKRTNVAMAAIMRRANKSKVDLGGSDAGKQVSFKTPSPAPNSSQDSSNMSQESGGGFPSFGDKVENRRQQPAFEVPPRFLGTTGKHSGLSYLLGGKNAAADVRGTPPLMSPAVTSPLPGMPPPRPPADFSVPPPPVLAPQLRPAALGLIAPRFVSNSPARVPFVGPMGGITDSANRSIWNESAGALTSSSAGLQGIRPQRHSGLSQGGSVPNRLEDFPQLQGVRKPEPNLPRDSAAPSYSLFSGPSILGQGRRNDSNEEASPLEKILRDSNN